MDADARSAGRHQQQRGCQFAARQRPDSSICDRRLLQSSFTLPDGRPGTAAGRHLRTGRLLAFELLDGYAHADPYSDAVMYST